MKDPKEDLEEDPIIEEPKADHDVKHAELAVSGNVTDRYDSGEEP